MIRITRCLTGLGAMLVATAANADNYTWNSTNGGNWSDTSSAGWNAAAYPNAVDDVATISQNIGADRTITLDVGGGVTVGAMAWKDTASTYYGWTLTNTAGQAVTFAASSGPGRLTFTTLGGTSGGYLYNRCAVPLVLNSPLVISNSGNKVQALLTGGDFGNRRQSIAYEGW